MPKKPPAPAPAPEQPKRRGRGRPKIGARFQLALDDELYAGLAAKADTLNVPMAEVGRDAIAVYLGFERSLP